MSNTSEYELLLSYEEMYKTVDLYLTPTLITLGLVGNIIAFHTFYSTNLKRIPASHSMMALAVADNGYLFTVLLMAWLPKHKLDIYNKEVLCQLILLCNFVCIFLSPWYIVCLLIGEYLDLLHPSSKWRIKTTFRARLIVISLAIFAIVSYLHMSGMFGVHDSGYCIIWNEYTNVYHILGIADWIVVVFLPYMFFIPLLLRLFIFHWYDCQARRSLRGLQPNLRQHNNTKSISASHSNQNSSRIGHGSREASAGYDYVSGGNCFNNHSNEQDNQAYYYKPEMSTTLIVSVITLVSVSLSLPSNINRGMLIFGSITAISPQRRFAQQYAIIVSYGSYASRFFIYFLVSSTFRNHLHDLICQTAKRISVFCCRMRSSRQDISLSNVPTTEIHKVRVDKQTWAFNVDSGNSSIHSDMGRPTI